MGQFESFIGVDFWTALFVLLNTLAIFFVARRFLFEPVHKMIEDRQKEINDMYADAEAAKDEAEQAAAEYRQKLSQAQATSERLVKEAVDRGRKREDEIIRKAKEDAEATREQARLEGEKDKLNALNEARSEISSLAVAIAEKIVGRELNADDQAAMVDHFIDELGDQA